MEDGEEVLDPDDTSSVLNAVVNTINNRFEHNCLAEVVRVWKCDLIWKSEADRVPGNMDTIPGVPGP